MTKKEQIYEIAKYVCNACEFGIYRACRKSQTDVKSCSLALGTAKRIYKAGYRKVPDWAVVLTPEERDDEMKATNEILAERDDLIARVGNLGRENFDLKEEIKRLREVNRQLNNDYNRSWERLKSNCREIGELKAENKQLKTECALLDDELRIARQDTINVLNKLKRTIKNAIDTYYNKDGGGYYLAEDAVDDIDELLKEYEK